MISMRKLNPANLLVKFEDSFYGLIGMEGTKYLVGIGDAAPFWVERSESELHELEPDSEYTELLTDDELDEIHAIEDSEETEIGLYLILLSEQLVSTSSPSQVESATVIVYADGKGQPYIRDENNEKIPVRVFDGGFVEVDTEK